MQRKWTTLLRIFQSGVLNFMRNLSLAIAAMAVMVVTLTIILFSLIANATFKNTIAQVTDKIDISVFLQDTVSHEQGQKFANQLSALPNVERVRFLTKQQALARYIEQNKTNQSLVSAAAETGNPIPATILIKPRDLNKIEEIRLFLNTKEARALQTSGSPSYSGDRKKAIDNISHATNILQRIAAGAVIVFAIVSALIIFNTIQMAIFNRRDELTIMRLLGASTWYIRGPFIVESAMYGLISALISVLIINTTFVTTSTALQATSLGLLDISYAGQYFKAHFWQLLTLQVAAGMIIGTVSSVIATRRYLKFKVR